MAQHLLNILVHRPNTEEHGTHKNRAWHFGEEIGFPTTYYIDIYIYNIYIYILSAPRATREEAFA
jgi:hypothetical protein